MRHRVITVATATLLAAGTLSVTAMPAAGDPAGAAAAIMSARPSAPR